MLWVLGIFAEYCGRQAEALANLSARRNFTINEIIIYLLLWLVGTVCKCAQGMHATGGTMGGRMTPADCNGCEKDWHWHSRIIINLRVYI